MALDIETFKAFFSSEIVDDWVGATFKLCVFLGQPNISNQKSCSKEPFQICSEIQFFWVFCILLPACQRVMDNDTWLANVKVGPFSISERSEILQPILESTCLKIASSTFFPKKICHFKTRLKRLVLSFSVKSIFHLVDGT